VHGRRGHVVRLADPDHLDVGEVLPHHRVGELVSGLLAAVDPDELPLLVRATPVGVLHDVRTVRSGRVLHFDGLAAVAVEKPDVATVGVGEPELLVGPVPVGPLHDRAAVGGGEVVDVEDLPGMAGLQPVVTVAGVDELPLLVRAVVAGPLRDPRAVGRCAVVDVKGLATVAVHQHVPRARVHSGRRARGRVDGHRRAGQQKRHQQGHHAGQPAGPAFHKDHVLRAPSFGVTSRC
jgi:hypothetical protein